MSSKHTPGPWYLIADDGADFTAIATVPRIEGKIDPDNEVLGSSEWLRVSTEDLQLMAAAPEMYALTKKVNELLKCENGLLSAEGKCNDLLCEILSMVPANILAKAEGK